MPSRAYPAWLEGNGNGYRPLGPPARPGGSGDEDETRMRQLLATRETGNKLVVLVSSDITVGAKERCHSVLAVFWREDFKFVSSTCCRLKSFGFSYTFTPKSGLIVFERTGKSK